MGLEKSEVEACDTLACADADRDGRISVEELLRGYIPARIDCLDGAITIVEFRIMANLL
jgi:hypothetical protein